MDGLYGTVWTVGALYPGEMAHREFIGHRSPYSLVIEPISMNSQPITERMSASRRKVRDLGQIVDPMSVLPSILPIRSALIPSTSIRKLDHHGCPFAKPFLWSCGLCKSMASKCQAHPFREKREPIYCLTAKGNLKT
jgi:hypothetical protein